MESFTIAICKANVNGLRGLVKLFESWTGIVREIRETSNKDILVSSKRTLDLRN